MFNDRTLDALAAHRPGTEEEFLAIPGLGPAKWQRFGTRLLAFLAGEEEAGTIG